MKQTIRFITVQAQKDKADLKKRLELLELQGQGGGRGRAQQATASVFSTWIVLLVAVLAFLLGKYLAVSTCWRSSSAITSLGFRVFGRSLAACPCRWPPSWPA